MPDTEYKSVCDRCNRRTWYEGGEPCRMTRQLRCECCRQTIDKYEPCGGTLRAIDLSALDPRFHRFYGKSQRIKVDWYGMTVTGTVSRTTGWKPCYLLMPRVDSVGSVYTLDSDSVRLLAVKVGDRYVPA